MTKTFILLSFLFCTICTNAQSPSLFEITPKGFSEFVVTEVPGKSKADCYNKVVEFVQNKFKDNKSALKSKIENESIVFEGAAKPLVALNPAARVNYPSRYQMVVNFKDGRFKLELLSLEYFVAASQIDAGGWNKINLKDVTLYYTRNGELRSTYKHFGEIPEYFNKLNDELKQYILSESTPAKKSEW